MLARLGLVLSGVVAGVACLVALEFALYLVGVGGGAPAFDPFSGFSASVPLFERRDGSVENTPSRTTNP